MPTLIFLAIAILVSLGVAVDWVPGMTRLDQHRVGQIALLGLTVATWSMRTRFALVALCRLSVPVRAGLGLFFALGLMSVYFAPLWKWAALEWSSLLLLVALSVWLASAVADEASGLMSGLSVLLGAVAVVVALKVMIGYVAALAEGVRLDTLLLFEGTFSNRRFFGQLATLLIPLLAWQALVAKRFQAGWLGLVCIWWMLVLASGTRGSWLALMLAHGVLWGALGRRAWPYMRVQVWALALGAAAYGVLFYVVPGWLGAEAGVESRLNHRIADLSQREVIWGLAWQYARAHPWLGIGPMQFAAYPNPVAAHPHNALLQLAAEWGIPAMLIAAGLVAYGLVAFAKPLWHSSRTDMLRLALLVSLLGAVVHSMVDGVIVIPYTQTWLAIVAGWAMGVHFQDVPVSEKPISMIAATGLRAVVLFALVGLLWGVWPEILNRAEVTAAYLEHHDSLEPRFWAQGWIQ